MRRKATRADAERRLTTRRPLANEFTQVVLLVTLDSVIWCSAALYERVEPYHLVWTEHHGYFLEHDDEVAKIHVVTQHAR